MVEEAKQQQSAPAKKSFVDMVEEARQGTTAPEKLSSASGGRSFIDMVEEARRQPSSATDAPFEISEPGDLSESQGLVNQLETRFQKDRAASRAGKTGFAANVYLSGRGLVQDLPGGLAAIGQAVVKDAMSPGEYEWSFLGKEPQRSELSKLVEAAVKGMVEEWSHPLQHMYREPVPAAIDIVGALAGIGGASGLLAGSAKAAGLSRTARALEVAGELARPAEAVGKAAVKTRAAAAEPFLRTVDEVAVANEKLAAATEQMKTLDKIQPRTIPPELKQDYSHAVEQAAQTLKDSKATAEAASKKLEGSFSDATNPMFWSRKAAVGTKDIFTTWATGGTAEDFLHLTQVEQTNRLRRIGAAEKGLAKESMEFFDENNKWRALTPEEVTIADKYMTDPLAYKTYETMSEGQRGYIKYMQDRTKQLGDTAVESGMLTEQAVKRRTMAPMLFKKMREGRINPHEFEETIRVMTEINPESAPGMKEAVKGFEDSIKNGIGLTQKQIDNMPKHFRDELLYQMAETVKLEHSMSGVPLEQLAYIPFESNPDRLAKLMVREIDSPNFMKQYLGKEWQSKTISVDPLNRMARNVIGYQRYMDGIENYNRLRSYRSVKEYSKGIGVPDGYKIVAPHAYITQAEVNRAIAEMVDQKFSGKIRATPEEYRIALKKAVLENGKLLRKELRKPTLLVPDEVAAQNQLEHFAHLRDMNDYKGVFKPLKYYDKFTDWFRDSVLGLMPRWFIGNATSNTALNAMAGVSGESYAQGVKYGRQKLIPPEISEGFARNMKDPFYNVGKRLGSDTLHTVWEKAAPKIRNSNRDIGKALDAFIDSVAEDGPLKAVAGLGYKVNDKIESFARNALYVDGVKTQLIAERGIITNEMLELRLKELIDNPELAKPFADHVNKYLFDYSALTPFEKTVIRRVVPFYSWIKNISQFTIAMPFRHPMKSVIINRIKEIGTDWLDDEYAKGGIERSEMESWQRGMIPLGRDRRSGDIIMLNPVVFNMFQSVSEVSFGMLNPVLTTPTEYATNRDLFKGREFVLSPGDENKDENFFNIGRRPDFLTMSARNLPQYQILENLMQPYAKYDDSTLLNPKPLLDKMTGKPKYPKRTSEILGRIFAVGIFRYNPKTKKITRSKEAERYQRLLQEWKENE